MACTHLAFLCIGFTATVSGNLRKPECAHGNATDGSILLQVSNHREKKTDAKEFATPALPVRKLTPSDWAAAAGKFVQIPSRREGVVETLFAKPGALDQSFKCGTPCVAHCIAGQPREMLNIKGLWKSIKHRLFDQFSESPVVFALLALGATFPSSPTEPEGTPGYVRSPQPEVNNEAIRPSLDYLGVDRALLLREACTTGECLAKGLKLKCKASELGIQQLFDKKTGIYSNQCELQVSRFRDALELVRDYEAEHQMKFDWVTRPRPDVYFTRPVTPAFTLDVNSAHVSPWAACGYGGMDWFYALPRKHADTVAEFSTGVSCSDFKSSPEIQHNCYNCPGCECWMAAWMFAKNVSFTKLPWQWFTPSKFCGAEDCPADWDVTSESILGVDSRIEHEPCKKTEGPLWCPMLLSTGTHRRPSVSF